MGELGKKRNPGILSWDPTKARPMPAQVKCPYCWFSHHMKNVVTRHINEEHWQEKETNEKNL